MRWRRSLAVRPVRNVLAGLLACVLAAATAGCSAWILPAGGGRRIEHWGAFFGGMPGNYDRRARPVTVRLPGTIAEIGSSNSTQYALLTNGTLYAWGLGTQGQLGDGRTANSFTKPVRVKFPAGVKIASIPADAMPYDTGLAVDTNGNVWGWGRGGFGDLCLRSGRIYLRPVEVPLPLVSALAGASNHVLYDSAGTVYACGQDLDGDLGDGHMFANSARPVRVAGLNGQSVVKLVASFADSGALLSDGRYFDWGYNGDGQLGDGLSPASSDVPIQVHLRTPVTQVAQGGSLWGNGQTLVLLSDNSLWSWGDNSADQLGTGGHKMARVPVRFYAPPGVTYSRLATGTGTSYAISSTGRVYAWGTSFAGQMGDGRICREMPLELVASAATAISVTANDVVILEAPRGRACRLRPRGGSDCKRD
jgi:alpha-tubulin suppressor-like RCC1 family protein